MNWTRHRFHLRNRTSNVSGLLKKSLAEKPVVRSVLNPSDKSLAGRLLHVAFTIRTKKIRVISARDMHRKERKIYEEKSKADS